MKISILHLIFHTQAVNTSKCESHLTVCYNLKKFSLLKHFVLGPVTFPQENEIARTVTTEAWILGLCCVLLRHEHEQ